MSDLGRKNFLRLGAGGAVAGVLAPSAIAKALAASSMPVRLGWQPTLNGARFFVARDEGLFAKNGLDVDLLKFTSGPAFFAAFQSKSIDVGFMGTPPAIIGIAQGVPMEIFAVENYAPGSEALVARAGSGITTLKDMKGKKIATARGSSGDYALRKGLKKAGLTLDDIQLVDLSVPALLPAFRRGDIDAGWYWEPWQGEMVAAGGTQIADDSQVGAFGGIVWVARTEWLQQNGAATQKLLHTIDDATATIVKDPRRAAAYIAKDIGVSESIALRVLTKEATWPTMRQSYAKDYVLSINPQTLKEHAGLISALLPQATFLQESHSIAAVPDFLSAINTSALSEYLGVKA